MRLRLAEMGLKRRLGCWTDGLFATAAARGAPRACLRGDRQLAMTHIGRPHADVGTQLTKSRLKFAPVSRSETWLLAREVDLDAIQFSLQLTSVARAAHACRVVLQTPRTGGRAPVAFDLALLYNCQNSRFSSAAFPGCTYCMFHSLRTEASFSCWTCRSGSCRWRRRRWSAHLRSSRAHRLANGWRVWRCRWDLPFAAGWHAGPL